MEKQGVIKPGLTPPEQPENNKEPAQKQAAEISELDNDFRKRAAETVYSRDK